MTPLEFVHERLLARGAELVLKGNRLTTWPKHAWTQLLTDADRIYIREHRVELKDLVLGGLPQTTVVWPPPAPPAPPPGSPPRAVCPYCYRSPCIGESHWAFSLLHENDPAEAERRNEYLRNHNIGGVW